MLAGGRLNVQLIYLQSPLGMTKHQWLVQLGLVFLLICLQPKGSNSTRKISTRPHSMQPMAVEKPARKVSWERYATVDGQNPATPEKPWNDDSPLNTSKQWLPMVSKWCRISSIHGISGIRGTVRISCGKDLVLRIFRCYSIS